MNRARLRIIDSLLQKGWQSYYDIAKAIHAVFNEPGEFGRLSKFPGIVSSSECEYDAFLTAYRPSISHDFLDIPDIWAFSHRGVLSKKGKSTGEKNQLREEARSEVFDIKEQNEFLNNEAPELYIKGEKRFRANPKVLYFRYKNPKYSIFKSGDYEKYVAQGTKKRAKSAVERSIKDSVTNAEVTSALYDSDVILDAEVSDQIKRSIRIQEEIREFTNESKRIVDSYLQQIASESDQKKRNWVKKTVNRYRNILELVRNPLSNYGSREVAAQIHDFAFFLASENQYHLLGNRFDEALAIYLKLIREQRHLIEDIEKGLVAEDEANIDTVSMKEQMAQDDESVASILFSLARVYLDTGDIAKAKIALDQAKELSCAQSLTHAQCCHLWSIIAGLEGDMEKAQKSINTAAETIRALALENSSEGLSILASKAELLQRIGDTKGAKSLFEKILENESGDDLSQEVQASVKINLALIYLTDGKIEEAGEYTSDAIKWFQKQFEKEPDKTLPGLLNAEYLKGLVLVQKGDINEAITTLEDAGNKLPDNRHDLFELCGAELLEIFVTLHDLYRSVGKEDCDKRVLSTIEELLADSSIPISDAQRNSIELSL